MIAASQAASPWMQQGPWCRTPAPRPFRSSAQTGSSRPAAEPSATAAATIRTASSDFRILLMVLSLRVARAVALPDVMLPRTSATNLSANAAEASTRKGARGIEPQTPAPSLNWRRAKHTCATRRECRPTAPSRAAVPDACQVVRGTTGTESGGRGRSRRSAAFQQGMPSRSTQAYGAKITRPKQLQPKAAPPNLNSAHSGLSHSLQCVHKVGVILPVSPLHNLTDSRIRKRAISCVEVDDWTTRRDINHNQYRRGRHREPIC